MNTNRNAYAREWRARNRDKVNEQQRARYASNPIRFRHQTRDGQLASKYGITREQYDNLFEQQGGLCAICKQPETVKTGAGVIRRLAVDHDHDTGRVRGLLCYRCNTTLGQFELRAEAILAYLGEYIPWLPAVVRVMEYA